MKTIASRELPCTPANDAVRSMPAEAIVQRQMRLIRNLIWLYIILWLVEGGLRRWFLPGLASPLLLVRDPLVIAIYCVSVSSGLFPVNAFVVWGAMLALLSFLNAMVMGHGNFLVALYGVRCDFIHVPLIFVMGKALRESDIIALAKVAVWVAIPYSALLVAQFYMPQDAWVNRGVGGDLGGGGFDAAMGRFRPPGTFSFTTGPSQLYPLFTACWFALFLAHKLPVWTMVASGAAILASIPISISRTLFLSVAIVAVTGVSALFVRGRFSFRLVIQFVLGAAIISALASQSQIFRDGMEAFSARWELATTEQGGFKEAIVDRLLNDLFGSFEGVRSSGLGTGYSTNVGQKALTSEVGFGASEAEWGRLLYDNGFILGSFMIAYRVAIACAIALVSYRAWRRGSTSSLLFASACFVIVLNGQWGQTTTLGSAVIGGGLAVAAASNCSSRGSRLRLAH